VTAGTANLVAGDGHRFTAYCAGDPNASRAVVLVQEIFGITPHMRHVTDRFAELGFYAVAPALFDRVEPGIVLGYEDSKRAHAVRKQVPDEIALRDVVAAGESLAAAHKAIVGYCWGGTLAWLAATRSEAFDVAVGWYGSGIAATRTEQPRVPVQLHFGGADHAIPLTDVELIRAAQPGVEIFVYPGAKHCFGCHDRADVYDPEATALAQQRTVAFLEQHMR
jgi:carboxymethylenebutenolidase